LFLGAKSVVKAFGFQQVHSCKFLKIPSTKWQWAALPDALYLIRILDGLPKFLFEKSIAPTDCRCSNGISAIAPTVYRCLSVVPISTNRCLSWCAGYALCGKFVYLPFN
jgi:hypothetical protein